MTQADVRARTRVVRAHSRLRQDDGGGSALMMRKVTLVTAVMKAREGQPWARRRRQWDWTQGTKGGGSGGFRSRWEGENVKWHVGQPPPLLL